MREMFLKVDIAVKKENVAAFEDKIGEFIRGKLLESDPIGWQLAGAFKVNDQRLDLDSAGELRRPSPGSHQKGTVDTDVRFLHIWKLPPDASIEAVANAMSLLNDVPLYKQLDSLVKTESQDLYLRIIDPIEIKDPSDKTGKKRKNALDALATNHKGGRFAFVRHYVDRDKLGAFAFHSGALAPQWGKRNKWSFLGTYQSITGLLNVFWDVWETSSDSAEHKVAALDTVAETESVLTETIKSTDVVTQAYAASINRDKDGPHDGLVVASAAPYWP